MVDKLRLGKQVCNIAEQYGITQVSVREIIDCYLRYCKDLLVCGSRVDFYGLVSIVPDYIESSFNTTLAYECNKVADVLHLPRHTAYAVVNAYIQDAIESIHNGVAVEIRGIVTVSPIRDETGNYTRVNSSISQSLKTRLGDTNVTGFRVHTAKSLKCQIRQRGEAV